MNSKILIGLLIILVVFFGCAEKTSSNAKAQSNTPGNLTNNSCDSIDTINSKEECWVNIVRETMDDSVCSKLTVMKDDCYDVLAFGKNDSKYCGFMVTPDRLSLCYFAFAESESNYSLCDKATVENIRDECYYQAASNTQDKSYCSKILNQFTKQNCDSLTFSEIEAEMAQCKGMESYGGSAPDVCWTGIAEKYEDASYCENAKISEYKQVCLVTVALKKEDALICAQITDTITKDNCYLQIAIKIKDLDLCDNMSGSDEISLCEFAVSNAQ